MDTYAVYLRLSPDQDWTLKSDGYDSADWACNLARARINIARGQGHKDAEVAVLKFNGGTIPPDTLGAEGEAVKGERCVFRATGGVYDEQTMEIFREVERGLGLESEMPESVSSPAEQEH